MTETGEECEFKAKNTFLEKYEESTGQDKRPNYRIAVFFAKYPVLVSTVIVCESQYYFYLFIASIESDASYKQYCDNNTISTLKTISDDSPLYLQQCRGEDALRAIAGEDKPQLEPSPTEPIKDKKLTFEEASRCLNTLGKDETGSRYAYLMITATDRGLTDVSTVLNFKHVLFIDLSGNYLTAEALKPVTELPFLVLLKAERNRVEHAGLPKMHFLQVLDLNQNQIKETATIDQPLLDCLELNHNDIYSTQFDPDNLESLKQLEMRSNLLFEISGPYPSNLEKLYVPANKISSLDPLTKLTNLQILHLRDNNIQKLDGFTEELGNLRYLNLRNNQIAKVKEFTKLQSLPKLEILIVTGNPVAGAGQAEQKGEGGEGGPPIDAIRIPILVLLPNLKRINKLMVTVRDRMAADDIEMEVLAGIMDELSETETEQPTTATDLSSEYRTETETDRDEEDEDDDEN